MMVDVDATGGAPASPLCDDSASDRQVNTHRSIDAINITRLLIRSWLYFIFRNATSCSSPRTRSRHAPSVLEGNSEARENFARKSRTYAAVLKMYIYSSMCACGLTCEGLTLRFESQCAKCLGGTMSAGVLQHKKEVGANDCDPSFICCCRPGHQGEHKQVVVTVGGREVVTRHRRVCWCLPYLLLSPRIHGSHSRQSLWCIR